jgi:hypothetical protein
VSYSVFRGVGETFKPSAKNRIASGLTKTSYVATGDKDYYYAVKAVTTAKLSSAMARDSECHTLILMLNEQVTRFQPSSQPTGDQQLVGMQRLLNWTEELDGCVLNSPRDLSIKDWQNAVYLHSDLTRKFDEENAASKAEEGQHTLRVNLELFNTDRQQWLNEYNDLVHKYNDLVRDYNAQAKLLAMPPPPMHCITLSPVGGIGSIDCY